MRVFERNAHGCRLLVQASSFEDAEACEMIAAIGPQTEPSAETLCKRGGEIDEWRATNADEHNLRAWALPTWARVKRAIVSADDLVDADESQAMLFVRDLPPIRARSICIDGPPATFLTNADLKPVAHDWEAPPAIPIVPAEAVVASLPETPNPEPDPAPAPTSAAIRAALTRRARPKPKARAS